MPAATVHCYLIALGSNRRHARHGGPRGVLEAALATLAADADLALVARATSIESDPIGPSQRRFANSAALIESRLEPPGLLARLKALEQAFGRRGGGRRWRDRVLDLDIVLWSGGAFCTDELIIPHPLFRSREFVLGPAARIAPDWRDPLGGLTVRQLRDRLRRRPAARRHR